LYSLFVLIVPRDSGSAYAQPDQRVFDPGHASVGYRDARRHSGSNQPLALPKLFADIGQRAARTGDIRGETRKQLVQRALAVFGTQKNNPFRGNQ
jgi:hypothetical protein